MPVQRHNAIDKFSLESPERHCGYDAAPLGIGNPLFHPGGKSFCGNAETHLNRVVEASFPAEQLPFEIPEPAVLEDTALQAFLHRPFPNRAKSA